MNNFTTHFLTCVRFFFLTLQSLAIYAYNNELPSVSEARGQKVHMHSLNVRKCDSGVPCGKQTFAAVRLHPFFLSAFPNISALKEYSHPPFLFQQLRVEKADNGLVMLLCWGTLRRQTKADCATTTTFPKTLCLKGSSWMKNARLFALSKHVHCYQDSAGVLQKLSIPHWWCLLIKPRLTRLWFLLKNDTVLRLLNYCRIIT